MHYAVRATFLLRLWIEVSSAKYGSAKMQFLELFSRNRNRITIITYNLFHHAVIDLIDHFRLPNGHVCFF